MTYAPLLLKLVRFLGDIAIDDEIYKELHEFVRSINPAACLGSMTVLVAVAKTGAAIFSASFLDRKVITGKVILLQYRHTLPLHWHRQVHISLVQERDYQKLEME